MDEVNAVTLEQEVFIRTVRWEESKVPPAVTVYVENEREREAVTPMLGRRVVMSVTYRLLSSKAPTAYARPTPAEEAGLEGVPE